MTMNRVHETVEAQFATRRRNPDTPAIKINLYDGREVRAAKQAIDSLEGYCGFRAPDCFMLGDSLLTTHLGRSSTRLETVEEQDAFIERMLEAVEDVQSAIEECFQDGPQPYLMGDLPDGSSASDARLLKVSEKLLEHGADVVKLEVSSKRDLALLELLAGRSIPVAAHVGYAPQKNENRQYGQSLEEALALLELVQLVRDCGACALVLERVAEVVNQVLCIASANALPVYSIFSGKARGGGQSLNVWDSVYKPGFRALFFPPTALHSVDTYPYSYTPARIAECFQNLLRLTLSGEFPKSPSTRLSSEHITYLKSIDPWTHRFMDGMNPT